MRDGGLNHPSIDSTYLTTVRKIMPHATSSKREKAGRVCDQGADVRERGREIERTLEKLQSE